MLTSSISMASISCFVIAAWISHAKGTPYFLEPLGMYVPRARNLFLKRIYNRVLHPR